MPLTPQVIVAANLQQITGSVDAAKAVFELVGFGSTVPRVSGTTVIVQTSTTATADVSGNISVTIWGLDVITPSGCFYTVTFFNDAGAVVASLPYNAFVGSGTFDLSQVVPMGQVVVAPQSPNSAIPQIFSPVLHQFLTGMNSSGVFSAARPSAADLSDTATAGNVLRGNGTSFVSAVLGFSDLSGTVIAAQLPLPTASTLGGVKSLAAVSHNFLTSIGTNGLPTAAQPAFTDISGTASTAQIPNLAASTITSGLLTLARGGTNADLSATGGAHQVLKQASLGAAITVAQLAAADLSDAATTANVLRGNGTSFVSAALAAADLSNGVTGSGSVVLAASPTITGTLTCSAIKQISLNSFNISDPLGVSHFFISASSPYQNSFVNGNGSGVVFLGSTAKTNVADTTGNITTAGSIALQTTSQTLPGVIANDTAGGILFTNNAGKTVQFGNGGTLFLGSAGNRGQGVGLFGATSGDAVMTLSATGGTSSVITIPNTTDTLVGKATTDTLSNKTLASPVISGTITSYNGTTTSGNGVAAVIGTPVDIVSSTTPSSGNLVASAPATGMYRCSVPAGIIGGNGGASGGSVTLTVAGVVVKTIALGAGVVGSTDTWLATTVNAFFTSGTAITYSYATSGTATLGTVAYTLHIRTELLG